MGIQTETPSLSGRYDLIPLCILLDLDKYKRILYNIAY